MTTKTKLHGRLVPLGQDKECIPTCGDTHMMSTKYGTFGSLPMTFAGFVCIWETLSSIHLLRTSNEYPPFKMQPDLARRQQ